MSLFAALFLTWALGAAGMDLLRRKVRWWWSLIGLLGAGGYRLAVWVRDGFDPGAALTLFVVVTASYGLWKRGWWGGADAKMAMTLALAIPEPAFIGLLAVLGLLVSSLMLLARRGEQSVAQVVAHTIQVVRAGENDGERLPLVAVMAAAVPVYLVLTTLLP